MTFNKAVLCIVILYITTESVQSKCSPNIVKIDDDNVKIKDLAEHCKEKPCLPKCCSGNQIFVEVNGSRMCQNQKSYGVSVDYNKYFFIYETDTDKRLSDEKEAKKATDKFLDYPLVTSYMNDEECALSWSSYPSYILKDGQVLVDYGVELGVEIRKPTDYCVELLYNVKNKNFSPVTLLKRLFPTEEEDNIHTYELICSFLSAISLLLVFLIHLLLEHLRTSMAGLLLMAYVATLFVAFCTKIAFSLSIGSCVVTSLFFIYSFLSVFFWLNVISFDIWWAFRADRYQRNIHRRGIYVKFGWYTLYACGVPLLMTLVDYILYKTDFRKLPKKIIKPDLDHCLVGGTTKYYVVIPDAILNAVNIILFVMTVYNIYLMGRDMAKIKRNDTNRIKQEQNKNRFRTYMKLSLVMGISWLLEFILQFEFVEDDSLPAWAIILFTVYNYFYGVLIFIIFICNKKTLRMLFARLNIRCCYSRELATNPSTRTTTTTSTKTSSDKSSCRKAHTEESDLDIEYSAVSIDPKRESGGSKKVQHTV